MDSGITLREKLPVLGRSDGQVDRTSASEAIDSGAIPESRVESRLRLQKIGVHGFSAWRSALKGTAWRKSRLVCLLHPLERY